MDEDVGDGDVVSHREPGATRLPSRKRNVPPATSTSARAATARRETNQVMKWFLPYQLLEIRISLDDDDAHSPLRYATGATTG